jgi:hypothetical protein
VGVARATCTSGLAVYTVGYDAEDKVGAVEARDVNTGQLLGVWKAGYSSNFHDCIVLGDYLYVVGADSLPGHAEWVILKFTLDLNLVDEKHYDVTDKGAVAASINTDGKYLYIGGYDYSTKTVYYPDDSQYHLIKVEPGDLSILKTYMSNPSRDKDWVNSININPVNGEIWLAVSMGQYDGKIVVVNQDLKVIGEQTIYTFAFPQIAFDESGYAYITGMSPHTNKGGLAKLSPDLKTIKTNIVVKGNKILYNNGYLYIAVEYYVDNYRRHVLVMATKNLDVLETLVLSSGINADAYLVQWGKMDSIGDNIFVSGYYYVSDTRTYNWITYSVKTNPPTSTTETASKPPIPSITTTSATTSKPTTTTTTTKSVETTPPITTTVAITYTSTSTSVTEMTSKTQTTQTITTWALTPTIQVPDTRTGTIIIVGITATAIFAVILVAILLLKQKRK